MIPYCTYVHVYVVRGHVVHVCIRLSLQAGRTPIQLANDGALADLLKILQLKGDSSAPHCTSHN